MVALVGSVFPGFSRSGASGLSKERVFEILKNKRRRYAFHFLRQQEEEVELSELATHVAAWEYDTDPEELDADERQRVYVSLLQSHLPKMDSADVVDFRKEDALVGLSKNAADIEVYTETVEQSDIPWAKYFLGLTGFSTGFLTLLWLDISPFTLVSGYIGLGLCGAFFLSALLYHRYLRNHRLGTTGPPPNGY